MQGHSLVDMKRFTTLDVVDESLVGVAFLGTLPPPLAVDVK